MKIQTTMAVALAALAILSGCSKEDTPKEKSGTSTVLVQISKADPDSRAEADKVSTTDDLTLGTGHIFFTEPSGLIIRHVEIMNGTASGDDQINLSTLQSNGATINNVQTTARYCYILMKGSSFSIPTISTGTTNISEVMVKTMSVDDIYDNPNGGVEKIPLWGRGDMSTLSDGNMKTDVELYAMGARLQIEKLTGGTDITSYKLAGIFLNNYFDEMPISYRLDPDDIVDNKSNVDLYVGGSSAYPSGNGMYDYYTTAIVSNGAKSVELSPGKVWAYNIWPTEGVPTADLEDCMPHLVIMLTDVVYNENGVDQPMITTPMYLTVKGMKAKTDQTPIIKIEKGNSYTFTDIAFDFGDLTTVPEVQSVDAEVNIRPMKWKDNEVEAEL